MFLWLDEETAIYIKIDEGIKISLEDIIDRIKSSTSLIDISMQYADRILGYDNAIFFYEHYPTSKDAKTFDDNSSINLVQFMQYATEHLK